MDDAYTQAGGGMRWGSSYWISSNATMPFGGIRVSPEGLVLTLSFFGLWRREFVVPRANVVELRWQRGLFSSGLQVKHSVAEHPPFLLFWPVDRRALTEALKRFGFAVSE